MLRQRQNIASRRPAKQNTDASKTAKTRQRNATDVDTSPDSRPAISAMRPSPPVRPSARQGPVDEHDPLLPASSYSSFSPSPLPSYDASETSSRRRRAVASMKENTQWLALAVASGACAAFNGVFAKLTTTELTTSWATFISTAILGLKTSNVVVEFLTRATFFGLNLVFNAVMWALFTSALTRSSSTTHVAIVNTSSNFVLTAVLGFLIFREALPPLWWFGASLLVVGNVIIGRRDADEHAPKTAAADVESGSGSDDDGTGSGEAGLLGKERDGEGVVFWGDDEGRGEERYKDIAADAGRVLDEDLGLELEDDYKGGVGPSSWQSHMTI